MPPFRPPSPRRRAFRGVGQLVTCVLTALMLVTAAACGDANAGGSAADLPTTPAPTAAAAASTPASPDRTPPVETPKEGVQPPPPAELPTPTGTARLAPAVAADDAAAAYRAAVDVVWRATFNDLRMAPSADLDAADLAFVEPAMTPALRSKWRHQVATLDTNETSLRSVQALVSMSAKQTAFEPAAPWFAGQRLARPTLAPVTVQGKPAVKVSFRLLYDLVGREDGAAKRYGIVKDTALTMVPASGKWLLSAFNIDISFT